MRTPAILFFASVISLRAETADTLFFHGNVYTVNEKQPHAEAIAVKGDRIVFVGSDGEAQKLRGEKTRVIDLRSATVTPGFTDSHCHIFGIGERELTLNLEGTNRLEDFLAKIRDRVGKAKHGEWITGRGWIETFWKPPAFPTRHDLDKIAPGNPVFLERADGHASVANSDALRIAGVTCETAAPFGGEILKDKSGEPTGMLLDNAQDLVGSKVPKPTEAAREEALLAGVKREIALGWCEIQNAGSELDDQVILRRAFETNKIKLRIYNAAYGPGPAANELLKSGPTLNAFDHCFTQRTIKVIFDGALGSRGAALLAPYSDEPGTSGYLTQKPEYLRPMFQEALQRGIQVETHAIGDRANREILDLYEEAFKTVPAERRKMREPRWRVEHAQILSDQDLPRFAASRVIASMQPSHAISDLFLAPSRLGMERLRGAYGWNSLLKSGAVICGGSDAPVERGEPMIEFYAAVARKSIKGEQHEGWHPEQAVSRDEALKMFTINAAYAAFEEKEKGSIELGKLADLTILDRDIMKIPKPEILKTRCTMTVIGGELVFNARP
jgi:predicted amidohydrolase YtcJ